MQNESVSSLGLSMSFCIDPLQLASAFGSRLGEQLPPSDCVCGGGNLHIADMSRRVREVRNYREAHIFKKCSSVSLYFLAAAWLPVFV